MLLYSVCLYAKCFKGIPMDNQCFWWSNYSHLQKCSVTEKTWGEVEFFWLLKKNGGTFCGTFYSFHDDLMSKNIARRQLDGQNLLFGVYLQTWTALYLLNSHNRGELDIDEGKHVLNGAVVVSAKNCLTCLAKEFISRIKKRESYL